MLLALLAVIATVAIEGLTESSGVAASRVHPGVFWTHNDGSNGTLYAFDREGKSRGRVRVTGAKFYDLEDIAIGPGNQVYLADIGDNNRRRRSVTVYRLPEPGLRSGTAAVREAIRMRYPDGPHDAEALLVHPGTGDIYIVTKARGPDARTGVYKSAAGAKSPVPLQHIADINLPDESMLSLLVGRITGGAISPDGKRVLLCDYFRAYEANGPGNNFDLVWKQRWNAIETGRRAQGEGITYSHDGKAIIATSEGDSFPLVEIVRKK
jgi:hypothetical protein